MADVLQRLKGGLIVSCQPVPGGALDRPGIVAAFARAALDGGAVGLRIEGLANLAAVRAITDAPVIGLIKVDLDDSPVRITPCLDDVRGLVAGGADIVAVDATDRARPVAVADLLAEIRALGALSMADCASLADARVAHDLGFDILGSTMSGYTDGPVPEGPDLDLIAGMRRLGGFVVAEGRYQTPAQAAQAIAAGADAVVAGSAITRPEHVTEWFVTAIRHAGGAA